MIVKENGKYILRSKDGSKTLGTLPTREAAEAREKEILAITKQDGKYQSVRRFDRNLFSKVIRRDNGFLDIPGSFTRVGVFPYRDGKGGLRRELRLPEEVFNQDSMDTLKRVTVTNTHPFEGFVDTGNSKSVSVGFTGDNIEKNGINLDGMVTITEQNAINDVNEKKKEELSCGYDCDLEHTSGVYNGERYDAIQRNIRYNHVAIVENGRAGSKIKLHLDSQDAIMIDKSELGDNFMEHITIEGKKFDVDPELKKALDQEFLKIKKDAMNEAETQAKTDQEKEMEKKDQEVEKVKEDNVELQKKVDAKDIDEKVKADNDSLKADNETMKKKLDVIDKKESEIKLDSVVSFAKSYMGDKYDVSGKTEMDIKKDIVAKRFDGSTIKLDSKTDGYFEHAYDGIVADFDLHQAESADLGGAINKNRVDGANLDEGDKPRLDSEDELKNAYKVKTEV